MSNVFWRSTDDAYTEADQKAGRAPNSDTSEQHPLPVQPTWLPEGADERVGVDEAAPLPVQVLNAAKSIGVLVITEFVEIPGIAPADALDAGDAMGLMGVTSKDINGTALPERCVIIGARLIDPDDDTLAATVWVYNRPLTTAQTSDSALAISAADSKNWLTTIPFASTADAGSAKVAEVTDWDSPCYLPNGALYWQFSTAGVPNIALGAMPLVQFTLLVLGSPV